VNLRYTVSFFLLHVAWQKIQLCFNFQKLLDRTLLYLLSKGSTQ